MTTNKIMNAEKIEKIETIDKMELLKEMLLNDKEMTLEICQSLNCWDGSLGEFNIYENDEEFFNTCFEGRPMEAVRAALYGEYKYMDPYVRFNNLGNLESLDKWDLSNDIEEYISDIMDSLLNNYNHIHLNEDILELIEAIKED